MTAIGETLRRERLRRNLDLEQISRELKISRRLLDAIESEQFDRLPGAVFAKSFVRQYARLLGLDEEDLAAEVQRQMEPAPLEPPGEARGPAVFTRAETQAAPMKSWESVGDGSRFRWSSALPALALVVLVMLVCSGVYAWWQRARHPRVSAPQAQTAQAQSPAAAAQAPAPPATPAAGPEPGVAPPSLAATSAGVPAASADRRVADGSSPGSAPASTSPDTENPVVRPAGLQPAAASGAPLHVELAADEPVWVRVRADGKFVFSGTIDANQSRTVDAAGAVEVLAGNAGGLNISLNGKPIGPVGPKGQVRTVQLSSGGFKIVSAKPEVPFDPL